MVRWFDEIFQHFVHVFLKICKRANNRIKFDLASVHHLLSSKFWSLNTVWENVKFNHTLKFFVKAIHIVLITFMKEQLISRNFFREIFKIVNIVNSCNFHTVLKQYKLFHYGNERRESFEINICQLSSCFSSNNTNWFRNGIKFNFDFPWNWTFVQLFFLCMWAIYLLAPSIHTPPCQYILCQFLTLKVDN